MRSLTPHFTDQDLTDRDLAMQHDTLQMATTLTVNLFHMGRFFIVLLNFLVWTAGASADALPSNSSGGVPGMQLGFGKQTASG